jgi:hypothetical protein
VSAITNASVAGGYGTSDLQRFTSHEAMKMTISRKLSSVIVAAAVVIPLTATGLVALAALIVRMFLLGGAVAVIMRPKREDRAGDPNASRRHGQTRQQVRAAIV